MSCAGALRQLHCNHGSTLTYFNTSAQRTGMVLTPSRSCARVLPASHDGSMRARSDCLRRCAESGATGTISSCCSCCSAADECARLPRVLGLWRSHVVAQARTCAAMRKLLPGTREIAAVATSERLPDVSEVIESKSKAPILEALSGTCSVRWDWQCKLTQSGVAVRQERAGQASRLPAL